MTLSERAVRQRVNRRAIKVLQSKLMSWHVYIAKARTGRYYSGITTNPQERLEEHNAGKGSRLALQQGPFELIYISNSFPGKSEARKREAQIKRWTRLKKEKLIRGEWK